MRERPGLLMYLDVAQSEELKSFVINAEVVKMHNLKFIFILLILA